jgi:hypothetical protein
MKYLMFFPLAIVLSCSVPEERVFDWRFLPPGKWVSVPTTGEAAPKVFHGGAAIVPVRGEVFFFGSDTHAPTGLEQGETNSVWRLNLKTLTWSKDYEQDPKATYRILPDSQTVTTSGRPWAMHTFDAVEYDPAVGRVVVVSFPKHARFAPQQRFPMFSGEWFTSLKPSHWEYDPDTKSWALLYQANAPDLFARAMAWDSDKRMLIATDGSRTWHFDRKEGKWIAYDAASGPGYHLSMVYDNFAGKALLLGKNGGSDTLFAYDPDQHQWSKVEVEGSTIPANGAAIAYDTRNHVMLYLANDYENQYNNPTGKSVTFIYLSREKKWTRLDIESPELYGMNYLMQYDPVRNAFLHFEKSRDSGDRIRVWAFRYK